MIWLEDRITFTLINLKGTPLCFLGEFVKIYEVAQLLMANNSCYFYIFRDFFSFCNL